METAQTYSFEACCASIAGDMAKALSERNGEAPEQRLVRAQGVGYMIMGFLPRDVIEVTLASHCVMFHQLMVAGLHDTLGADEAKVRRSGTHDIIALNKAFCSNLGLLRHYQKRVAEGSHAAPAETAAGSEAVAEQTAPAGPDQTPPVSAREKPSAAYRPTREAVAACRDNPAAQAALEAGDAEGFARAMGIAQPGAAFLAAAGAPGSPFNPATSGPWPESAWRNQPNP